MSLSGTTDSDPVQWSTNQVMEWMTSFTDSKEAIKQKILSIVRDNDLDGLALKQLRDDSEELHELLPVLKERLTFKAMMKKLLGSPFVRTRNCKMTVFKVWNSHRTTKKCVVGDTLKDVIEKGRVKLQLNGDLIVVLEEDGTEIDDDDSLINFIGATLILLEENETWKPRETDWQIHHPVLETGTNVPFTTESSSTSLPSVGDLTLTAADPNTSGTSFTDARMDLQENTSCSRFKTSRASRSVRDIALPPFSLLLQRHLADGTPHLVWDQLIAEAANFYQATTNIYSSAEYQAIGSKMFAAYPSIGMDGTKPWSLFTTNLSQRIRHMRWLWKKKSQSAANRPSPSAIAVASTPKRRCSGVDIVCLQEDEFNIHLKEVWQEWAKPAMERNEGHIKNLLKETFQMRQMFIKSLPDGEITPAMKSMPYLEEGKYLLYDFSLLLGPEAFSGLKKSMATLVKAVESLTGEKEEGVSRMLQCIMHIEKKTCFEKGKRQSSIIVQKEDIPDEDIQTELQTAPRTAPHIAVFKSSGEVTGSFIVGDGSCIDCQSDNIEVAVLTLLATYYVFDLDYPQIHSQVLGILQTYIIQTIPYNGPKSKNYCMFSTQLKNKISEIESSDHEPVISVEVLCL